MAIQITAKRFKIRIRRMLLDVGLCAVEVCLTLNQRGLSYIMPLKAHDKPSKTDGARRLFHGRKNYRTTCTRKNAYSRIANRTVTVEVLLPHHVCAPSATQSASET